MLFKPTLSLSPQQQPTLEMIQEISLARGLITRVREVEIVFSIVLVFMKIIKRLNLQCKSCKMTVRLIL